MSDYEEDTSYKIYATKGLATYTTNAPKNPQEFTLEPKARNCENIKQNTPEMQLRDLCPVWKTTLSPPTTKY